MARDEEARNAAIEAARLRRVGAAQARNVRFQWFLDEVSDKVTLTMKQRVSMATEYLRDKVVRNISRPVKKTVAKTIYKDPKTGKTKEHQRTVVSDRSKKGEFPKADTTQLMKSIFKEIKQVSPLTTDGYVGTPLDYGIVLETSRSLDRSFLVRTLREEKATIVRMLSGPISG